MGRATTDGRGAAANDRQQRTNANGQPWETGERPATAGDPHDRRRVANDARRTALRGAVHVGSGFAFVDADFFVTVFIIEGRAKHNMSYLIE